eukprot:6206761-Pleurochrysis_carterae.AAC.1
MVRGFLALIPESEGGAAARTTTKVGTDAKSDRDSQLRQRTPPPTPSCCCRPGPAPTRLGVLSSQRTAESKRSTPLAKTLNTSTFPFDPLCNQNMPITYMPLTSSAVRW